MCFGTKYCAWDLSLKLFSAVVVIPGYQYTLVSCFLVCIKCEKNPKPLKISVFKRSGLEKLCMLKHNAFNAVHSRRKRIFFFLLNVTLYTVFSFNVLMVSSIFFSHRVLQQWKSADVRDSSSLASRFGFASKQGSRGSCRTGWWFQMTQNPSGSRVLGEKRLRRNRFNSCPVVEVWHPKVSFSSMFVLSLPMRDGARVVLLHRWQQCGFLKSPGARGLQHSDPVPHHRGVPRPFACSLQVPPPCWLGRWCCAPPSLLLALPAWGDNLMALLPVPRRWRLMSPSLQQVELEGEPKYWWKRGLFSFSLDWGFIIPCFPSLVHRAPCHMKNTCSAL